MLSIKRAIKRAVKLTVVRMDGAENDEPLAGGESDESLDEEETCQVRWRCSAYRARW
jgi:hypothetical protein